jgi:hypothetical protein
MIENTIVLKRECVATRTGPRETETEAVVLWPWVRVICGLIAFAIGLGIQPWIVMAGLVPAIHATPP